MLLARLGGRAYVFRLVKNIRDHFPPNATKPLNGALTLTKSDFTDARVRGILVLYSVFDTSKTSIEQARAMRKQAESESTPFVWRVTAVVAIRGVDESAMAVWSDPNPWAEGPGARGHCGISGLCRGYEDASKGPDRPRYKAIRDKLIEECERYDAKEHGEPGVARRAVNNAGWFIASRFAPKKTPDDGGA